MKFEAKHISSFLGLSRDNNPLHVDAHYARRSQFGKPVVYGMAAVLMALGEWANGHNFRLRQLHAIFRKPLFEGENYLFACEEADGEATLRFCKGPVDYAVIKISYVRQDAPFPFSPIEALEDLEQANEAPYSFAQQLTYLANISCSGLDTFDLKPEQFPVGQLSALLWASYHVGMVLPGKQALFSEFKVEFEETPHLKAQLELDLEAAEFDDRFNRHVLLGKGDGIQQLRIVAFQRPRPVEFSLSELKEIWAKNQPLAGKNVFISGATRGFGAALARICGMAGAKLLLNYRGDQHAAESLQTELEAEGLPVQILPADMADELAVSQLAQKLQSEGITIDLVFANAAPPIRDLLFLEQDNAHFLQFLQSNMAILLNTARQLLPLMPEKGTFCLISTKYLDEPQRAFSHYLSSKAAQESLTSSLSMEFRQLHFANARLPRILTDQTNLPFDFDPPHDPNLVAKALVQAILAHEWKENFLELRVE
jgi:NAD(P)-dependent dehydrogenase (short-subunit alcohol dehydrogenase family)